MSSPAVRKRKPFSRNLSSPSEVPFCLGRWMVPLVLVAVCACSPGGGCADAKRDAGGVAGGVGRPAAGRTGPPPAVLTSRAGDGARTDVSGRRRLETRGTVVRVRDGDSIVVVRGGAGIEVRLFGVDCPELVQAFGRKSKSFTSRLALGKTVRLLGEGQDRYGRELAEVLLPDGRSLNRELVAAGFAWWYREYSADPTLEALEGEARTAGRGLWADPRPVPPWEFRIAR